MAKNDFFVATVGGREARSLNTEHRRGLSLEARQHTTRSFDHGNLTRFTEERSQIPVQIAGLALVNWFVIYVSSCRAALRPERRRLYSLVLVQLTSRRVPSIPAASHIVEPAHPVGKPQFKFLRHLRCMWLQACRLF
jgi:hypothetical protein